MLLFQKIITGQRRAGTQSIALLTMAYPQILYNHGFQFLMGITVVPREIEGHGYSFFFSQGAFMISVKTVIARESGFRNRKNLACVQSGVLGFGIGITTKEIRNPANE